MAAGKASTVPDQDPHANPGRFDRLDRIDLAILNLESLGLEQEHPQIGVGRPVPPGRGRAT